MKTLLAHILSAAASCAVCINGICSEKPYGTPPTQAHIDYHKREIIAIVHWGLNTYTDQEWGFGDVSPDVLRPDSLDPEQWVRAMAAGGIKAVILVCKHHDGFCLWPSPLNKDYSMSAVPGKYRGFDVPKAVSDACRKYNIDFGAYLSPWDRHQGSYATPEYVEYFHAQWDELMNGYGDICEIWLDGANGGDGWYGGVNGGKGEKRKIPSGYYQKPRLLKALHAKHPRALVFGGGGNWSTTWCGNERGTSPDNWWNPRRCSDGNTYWMPSEADTPFRKGGWFYHPGDKPKPLSRLVEIYFESVGRGAVLNFGIAPDRRGLVCDDDVKQLKKFGDWVKEFNARDFASGAKTTLTRNGNDLVYAIDLPNPARFNCVDIKEVIELGQRVKSFKIEVYDGAKWNKLAEGPSVGYRRLARFPEVTASKVRVTLKGPEKDLSPVRIHPVALRYARAVQPEIDLPPQDLLPKTGWKASQETAKALDGNSATYAFAKKLPASFAVDCGKSVTMKGFEYVPRLDGVHEGIVVKYAFEVSDDGKTWREIKRGEIGNIRANPIRSRIPFAEPVKARHFRFTPLFTVGEGAAIAELDLY